MTHRHPHLVTRVLCGVAWLLATSPVPAHELRPAYLEIKETEPHTFDVIWKVPARSRAEQPGIHVLFPQTLHGVSPPTVEYVNQARVQRSRVAGGEGLAGQSVRIEGLEATQTDVLVRVEQRNGSTQIVRLTPDRTSFVVQSVPARGEVAHTYLWLGVEHILLGVDHLLFVLGLLLIVPGRWMLLKTITAFTVAHSITLAIATLGYARAPAEPLNVAIALSILFLGPEIIRFRRGATSLTLRHPWGIAFGFGLLHGFGFASGLNTLGMPSGDIPLALLFFNLGVEVGQITFVLLILLLVRSFKVLALQWPRWVEAMPGYTVGSLGAYWFLQRLFLLVATWK